MALVIALLFLVTKGFCRLGRSVPKINQIIAYFKKYENQDTLIFIVLTALFLWVYRPLNEQWFPLLFGKALFCCFVILIIRSFCHTDNQQRTMTPLYYGMLFYLLLIVSSATLHYFAATLVGVENYIGIFKSNFHGVLFQKHEGVKRLLDQSSAFMYFFPFMLLVAISFFRSSEHGWKKLVWIAIIFVPCVFVAFYQVYIESSFFNNRPFSDPMGGLASSFISLRFLQIFPDGAQHRLKVDLSCARA